MRDNISNIQVKRAISPVSGAASDAAQVSQIIDRQGYDSLAFLIATGTISDADATFTVLVQDGDDSGLSDAAAVADSELVSQTDGTAPETAAAFSFSSDDQVRKIGYLGIKRYVRLTLTPANNTGAWLIAAMAVLGNAEVKPVIQATA